ncbi:rhomboid-like protein [Kitasatospora sp. NPDC002227]|uniref:rhomboid-like protein n=1 Tax=Kitasatospora sp. NPDC002227 TaxID=3154773 RepID=UPI00332F3542
MSTTDGRGRRAAARAWCYVRQAPGTFAWLAILFVTTQIIRHVSPEFADGLLQKRSTNIEYLSQDPVRVLITSALWIAGGGWFLYFLLYNLFHVPAERWLGTRRWLLVLAIAHVGATYLSEGVLLWAIDHGHAPESARYTLDYGVSYALAGIEAVLTYLIVKPWRYVYLAGVLLFYGSALITGRTFTDVGHFTAALLGLACYPLTRGRTLAAVGGGPFDPVATARRLLHRLRRPL